MAKARGGSEGGGDDWGGGGVEVDAQLGHDRRKVMITTIGPCHASILYIAPLSALIRVYITSPS